jgi:hypothetical protein
MIELILILFITLILASCRSDAIPAPTEEPSTNQPGGSGDEPYPAPGQEKPSENTAPSTSGNPYPEPEDVKPAEPSDAVIPMVHEFAPVSGDEKLTRGNVFIDESRIILLESYPVQVKLQLEGNLPTPCHLLRAVITPPSDDNRVGVEIYSLVDPDLICTQVLEPFTVNIPLGNHPPDFMIESGGFLS